MKAETLADLMRRLRGDARQKDFAQRVGISASMIGHVEAGSRSISLDAIERIARVLQLSDAERLALRNARERASAELTQRPAAPADLLASVMADLRALQEEVLHLRADVDRLLGGS